MKLLYKGEHLNKNDIMKIINLKVILNKELSEKLRTNFTDIVYIICIKMNYIK